MEKSAPETLKIRKILDGGTDTGPYVWHYELTGKDSVYGSTRTWDSALAEGLSEWRATYPGDFNAAPTMFAAGDRVAPRDYSDLWFGTVEFGDATGANVIELDGDIAWFDAADIVKL